MSLGPGVVVSAVISSVLEVIIMVNGYPTYHTTYNYP